MSDTLPSWKETREKILSQGIKEDELDAKVKEYQEKLGSIIQTKDLLYYMIAQKEYSMSLPKFSTLDKGNFTPGGEATLITLDKVNPELDPNVKFVKIHAYVLKAEVRPKFNGEGYNFFAQVVDSKGRTRIEAYREKVEIASSALEEGKYYEIDGLMVWQKEPTERFDASTALTWTKSTEVSEIKKSPEEFFADANTSALIDNQPCLFSGFITDDETISYTGCDACKRSLKSPDKECGRGNGTVVDCNPKSVEYKMYRASITNGNMSMVLSFGFNVPEENLRGSAVKVLGIYNDRNKEINVIKVTVLEKNALPSYDDMISGPSTTPTPTPEPVPESKAEQETPKKGLLTNPTPDDILVQFVQKPGWNPKNVIYYKIQMECGLSFAEVELFLKTKTEEGLIVEENDNLKWVGTSG